MAATFSARALSRSALQATKATPRSFISRATRLNTPKQSYFKASYRSYSTESSKPAANFETPPPPPPSGRTVPGPLVVALALAGIGGGAYLAYSQWDVAFGTAKAPAPFAPRFEDYQKVYDVVAKKLQDQDDWDDGSYGPVILRLAWHSSGTYDKETNTGGSNGATMRFQPEGDHGANAGLLAARDFLEPIQKQFPWISYGDLWTLAGVCAIQEMAGPIIPWRPGRQDQLEAFCTPDGRLPDASKKQDHLRAIFYRQGFNDQEIVALSGAHALGRCHTDRSGYTGPWTFSPTTLTNDYFRLLVEEKWQWKKWNGPAQYEDVKTKSLMMLPSDMAIVQDKKFRKFVELYARDGEKFFSDFSAAMVKLFENGVPFTSSEEGRFRFKPSE